MEVLGPLPCVASPAEIVEQIESGVHALLPQGQQRVADKAEDFAQVEEQSLDFSRSVAALLSVAVLRSEHVRSAVDTRSEEIRKQAGGGLRKVAYGPRWLCCCAA